MSERRVIPRAEWGSEGFPKGTPAYIGPKPLVFKHHTATRPTDHPTEFGHMRFIEKIAYSRGFNGISYSFVIFDSGNIYEGRGWRRLGAHTKDYNDDSHGIAFAGNYDVSKLTQAAKDSFRWLIARGKADGHITEGPKLKEHDAVSQTACPGNDVEASREELDTPWTGIPNPQPQPNPTPTPNPQPQPQPGDFDQEVARAMDRLDLRNATSKTPVTGRHVDNLQALLLAAGYGPAGLVGTNGRPDGRAGDATKRFLGEAQRRFRTGNADGTPDFLCWEGTWKVLITF